MTTSTDTRITLSRVMTNAEANLFAQGPAVTELVTSTADEQRRFNEAQTRREHRLARREGIRSSREGTA